MPPRKSRAAVPPALPPLPPLPIRGLGDLIHAVAQPIATVIDKAVGTNLKTCGACAKRREKLNQKFPL